MLLMLVPAAMVAGLDSQPEHDGFTTYCWKSKGNPLAKDLNETMKLVESHGRGCPVQLRLETTGTMVTKDGELVVGVLEALRVKWTAVASDVTSSANAFNLTRFYTIVTPISQYVQIPHSNLHACEFGPRPCTPFDRGENPTDNTPNQEMNFTTGKAQFEEPDLRFSKPGQYSLLAHVVLPGEAPSIRYDFVVYKKIVVKDVAPPPPPSESVPVASTNNKNTLYAVLGCVATLVLIAVAALVVNLQKRKNYASSKEVDIEEATTTVPNLTTSYPSTHNRPDTIYSQDQTFSFAPSSEHSSCSDRRMRPPMSTFEVRLGHHYHQPPPLPPPAHRDQFHYDDIEYRQPPPQYDPDRMWTTGCAALEWCPSAGSFDLHSAALLHGLSKYHRGEFEDSQRSLTQAVESGTATVMSAQVKHSSGRLWSAYESLLNMTSCEDHQQAAPHQHCLGRWYVLAQVYIDLGLRGKACDSLASILQFNRWHNGARALSSTAGCPRVHDAIADVAFVPPVAFPWSRPLHQDDNIQQLLRTTNSRSAMMLGCLEDHLVAASMERGCVPVLLNLGAMMHARKHYARAFEYYMQVLSLDPSHSIALSNCHAMWHSMTNSYEPSVIYLHSGARLDHRLLPEIPTPDDLDALALQAADAHGRGRRHIALAKLTMLVLFQPHNPFVLNDLGAVQFQLGLVGDAIQSFQRALTLHPRYTQALNNIATLAQEQGQNDVALSYYGRAMAVDSTDAHVRYNMGNTLMAMKRYDHVVRMYTLLFGLTEVLHWTASDMAELEDNDRSLSRQVLQPLGTLVAAMLVAYPAHMRFNCVQSVLTNEFDVHFRLNTSFEQVVRRTQLAYDRSWNVFGLALQATVSSLTYIY
ncbi:hypothetical protein, variant [Aphanomyces astaci]|uniref:Uncharacterized protein n=1 Tax=Aphanomyces astaci TaxID=112090 RepID=W4GI47_APHAT|nr:hypothetical protein, variant [Aphanomyces astaci]ETV79347.1 hypothetical protein, variant [Aphanomyces astaci]|eukprot:XP_009831188.1 hypothetical protein, variant [Aphanomyces astaci]